VNIGEFYFHTKLEITYDLGTVRNFKTKDSAGSTRVWQMKPLNCEEGNRDLLCAALYTANHQCGSATYNVCGRSGHILTNG